MRHLLLLFLLGFAVTLTSCRDDFEFETSSGTGLEFSRDTVYLDTVFTNIGSSTYTLKVYNRSNKDISIPSIKLGEGENSKYRLMVDGVPGKTFNNVELLAKDSMFVMIETTIDYSEYTNNETTFLYTDKIEFTGNAGQQNVELVTLVQDAVFIKPNRPLDTGIKETLTTAGLEGTEGHELTTPDELHWTNQKPYVVYGFALVPNGRTLTVDAGARVHFHAESGLVVDNTATIKIQGSQSVTDALENEVIFEGDRLEPDFADVPGQWSTLLIFSGSTENDINHLTIKNSTIGLYVQRSVAETTPKIQLHNTQIYNCTNYGILALNAQITGDNVVVNNAGQASVALNYGGTYNFKQCTFANYFNSYNQYPLILNDYIDTAIDDVPTTIVADQLTANFDNCIVYGSGTVGMLLDRAIENPDNYNVVFNHCLIKIVDSANQLKNNDLYPGETGAGNEPGLVAYNSCVLAQTSTRNKPNFEDPENNKLNIFTDTDVSNGYPGPEDTGDAAIAALVPLDITGFARSAATPDIGAYESKPEPAE